MSTLTITTIQPDLVWEDKPANLRSLEQRIMGIQERTELVVLPEMFSTGFSMRPEQLAEPMDGPTINWMRQIAANKRIILTGSLIIREGGHYYNRLIWMLPNGQFGHYDKRHRFAYAGENDHYTAGTRRLIASVKGWRINLQVCYDLRFPVWSRQSNPTDNLPDTPAIQHAANLPDTSSATPANNPEQAIEPEYDILLYVANWPERRSHAWKTLLQARAIENQSYVIGVNRVGNDGNNIFHSGDTMIVDPLGETLYKAEPKEETHTTTLEKTNLEEIRTKFPFWKDGDNFTIEP